MKVATPGASSDVALSTQEPSDLPKGATERYLPNDQGHVNKLTALDKRVREVRHEQPIYYRLPVPKHRVVADRHAIERREEP